jgi:small subunit ribosomal protein S18
VSETPENIASDFSVDEAAPSGASGQSGQSGPSPRGDRPSRREGGRGEGGRGGRDFRSRRKVCAFCVDKSRIIDYKDASRLRRFLSDRAKIEPRRKTGVCAKHQRRLSTALKRARFLALLPFTGIHLRNAERSA